MNPDLTKRIIDLLTRHMSQSDRRGYIDPWCIDYPTLYGKIDWSGAPRDFTVELVKRLNLYGTLPNGIHALAMLLQIVRTGVGQEDQTEIDAILWSMQEVYYSEEYSISRMRTTYNYFPPLPSRPFHFTGRDEILNELSNILQPQQLVTLHGPGGIGKTALALEVVYRMMDPASQTQLPDRFPDGVLYHCFYEEPTTHLTLINLLRQLDLQASISVGYEIKNGPWDHQLLEYTQRALWERRLLLVLDGGENAEDLQQILDISGNSGVLITTRKRTGTWDGSFLNIDLLSEKDAVNLLQKLIDPNSCDDKMAQKICQQIDNFPLAIHLVGNYMSKIYMSGGECLNWLSHSPLQALEQGQRGKEITSILLTRNLEQVSEMSYRILALMGKLASAPVDRNLLAAALNQESDDMIHVLGELISHKLLRRDRDGRYRFFHALIHAYASERLTLPPDNLEKLGIAYADFIEVQKGIGQAGQGSIARERVHILKLAKECADAELWSVVNRLEPNQTTVITRAMIAVT